MGCFMREKKICRECPSFFFSKKRMSSSIILLSCLSPSDLPNFCSRLLTSDIDLMKRRVHHFLEVQEKAADVPYCIIFEYTSVPDSLEFLLRMDDRCIIPIFAF
jgi:hypothetical protein